MVGVLRYLRIAVRVAGLAFCLLTSAYAVAAYSPFAFDMFLKPQLWPWLASFAAWHHTVFLVFAAISIATVVPEAAGRQGTTGMWLAWGYVGLRIIHSLIQCTVNVVRFRLAVFALASFCLLGLTVHAGFRILHECGLIG